MSSIASRAEAIATTIATLLDAEVRVAYLRHEVLKLDGPELADLVMIAAGQASTRVAPHPELMLSLTVVLADPAVEEARRAAMAAAASRGQVDVLRLLGRDEADLADGRVPDLGLGRPITLGERKSLARRRDRNLIARILRDPHPDVIRILLGNPSVTEDDVVRLCARRPNRVEVLREVARTVRWVVRYRVRRAIVLNPHTPLDLALQLAAHLTRQDMRVVRESQDLPDDLRRACGDESERPIH